MDSPIQGGASEIRVIRQANEVHHAPRYTSRSRPRRLPATPTKQEAAEWLRVSVRTLERYVKTGVLTASRTGPRRITLERGEVESLRRQVTP